MTKIDALTFEQQNQMIAFREDWRQIGLATGPANIQAITPVIHRFYAAIDKPAPAIWRCGSPLMIEIWINIFRAIPGANLGDNLRRNLRANLGDNLRANLWANLGANLGANLMDNLMDNLWDNLGANLWDNLGANLGANLRANLRANLGDNLGDNLEANLRDNLRANLEDNLRDNLLANLGDKELIYTGTRMWGSIDAYWVAYYLYPHLHLREMHNPKQMSLLNDWATLCHNCCWWYPFDGVCFVSDRPTAIRMNARWQMHSNELPSVEFSDGWKIYAVNGVHVPGWIIETPEKITPESIDSERNAEVRRVMIGKYGWKNYTQARGAKLIDKHENDIFGELWEYTDLDNIRVQFVHVRNGTSELDGSWKWYDLRVRPQYKSVLDAVASTYPALSREEFLEMSKTRS